MRPYIFTYDIFSIKLIPIDMNIESIFRKIFVAFFIKQKYFGIIPISLSDEEVAQVPVTEVNIYFEQKSLSVSFVFSL